jgi:carbamoyltransferase
MYTLGINAVYHDPSACLVQDGVVLAAAEEERFTHVKHGKRPVPFSTWELPFHAIDYCLGHAGIRLVDVDHVAYSYDPFQLLSNRRNRSTISLPLQPSRQPTKAEWENPWDPLFLSSIVNAPGQLASGAPHHLQERFRGAQWDGPYRWHFVDHHVTHAASAFHASPFQNAAILTLDGRGERATTSYSVGRGTSLERLGQVDMPHSLGLLYEQVTDYLGFLHSSDEYKVMALASFGQPRYVDEFRDIVRLGPNGQYTVQPPELQERFGPARPRGAELEARHYDLAASLQVVLEETVLELTDWLHRETSAESLCLAGGIALNCVMNARIRDRGPFQQVWVQPAAGDAGTALGAALWIDTQERSSGERAWSMDHAFLGPEFDEAEIESFLQWSKLPYRRLADLPSEVAEILAQDRVIGWFQGRMEFGPRALGARSIIASPRSG